MDQTPPTLAQTVHDQIDAMQRFAEAASAGFVAAEDDTDDPQEVSKSLGVFEVELLDAWALP